MLMLMIIANGRLYDPKPFLYLLLGKSSNDDLLFVWVCLCIVPYVFENLTFLPKKS